MLIPNAFVVHGNILAWAAPESAPVQCIYGWKLPNPLGLGWQPTALLLTSTITDPT
jgi:hypothetical protein